MSLKLDSQATPPRSDEPSPPAPLPDEPFYRRGDQARRWGGILLLAGLIWLGFAVGSRAALPTFGFVERTATLGTQTFAAERVVVNGGADHVEFVGWNQDQIQVQVVKHAFGWNSAAADDALEQLDVQITPRGDTLVIEVRRPLGSVIGRAPYADLRVALPVSTAAEAHVISGDISAEEVSGDLALTTVSGDITAANTRGTLTLNTTSGEVDVRDHAGALAAESISGDVRLAGDLASPTVRTVSGDARLDGATGTVVLSSISGDLSLASADLAGLDLESTSGDIEARVELADGATGTISNISGDVELRLPEDARLGLEVTTASGDLTSDIRGLNAERRSLRGAVGSGGGSLSVSTTSGDVEVRGE
jgi:hypothetical protein